MRYAYILYRIYAWAYQTAGEFLYMSLISVDFVSLEIQIKRLKEYLYFVEETYDKIQSVFHILENMSLEEIEDELRYIIHALQNEMDNIAADIAKLKKIYTLYDECENNILSDIIDLPLDMLNRNKSVHDFKLYKLFDQNTETFSGHSVINEKWLAELIFG